MSSVPFAARARAAAVLAVASALVLSGCVATTPDEPVAEPVRMTVGTTDPVTSLDPAGAYDSGSFAVMAQLYPTLLSAQPGSSDVAPDIADSAEFDEQGNYVVTLKRGLRFANGNKLTSGDVKFSFDRIVAINADAGPWALFGILDEIETPDAVTVVFHLKNPGDQTFPLILSSPAGYIVDEETFSADAVTSDDDIVKGNGFAGQYSLSEYHSTDRAVFIPNENYAGALGAPRNDEVELRFFSASADLAREVADNNVDLASGNLAASDLTELRADDTVRVLDGAGGEIRFLVFDFDTMPFGVKQQDADPAKALAVRQAIADVIDRAAIAHEAYGDNYVPLFGHVPSVFEGASEPFLELYGDGEGGIDVDRAAERLDAADVETPVRVKLSFTSDHFGEASAAEFDALTKQLDGSGLFKVELTSAPWEEYSKERTAGSYAAYQLGTFPDYADADAYLTPFYANGNVLKNHYSDAEVDGDITKQRTEADPLERIALIEAIQLRLAEQLPTLPLFQGTSHLVAAKGVTGVVLDNAFAVRFGSLNK